MKGILPINKPKSYTSFDVIARLRNKFHIKKIGHTGTLDPLASGVLVLCFGQATKIIQILQNDSKKYRAEIKLGITTDTDDITGTILQRRNIPEIKSLESILNKFIGKIKQVPPQYSAISHKGKRLYKYARAGEFVNILPRDIEIYDIKLLKFAKDIISLDIHCSKGTYIRSIARDLGEMLNCGGTLSNLERTASGCMNINDCFSLEDVLAWDITELEKNLYSIEYFLKDLYDVKINSKDLKYIEDGFLRYRNWDEIIKETKDLDVFKITLKNKIIALAYIKDDEIKLKRVFRHENI